MEKILVQHTEKLRVRYSETDQMGIVYYGNYAQYFEVARVEFLRNLGFVYKELEDDGVIMPVVRYETDYKFPAKYDEELSIVTSIKTLPTSKITFDYEVFNPEDTLVCTAKVILVFVNKKTFRAQRTPEKLVQLLIDRSTL
jgi:acyl-CoA thioester hydrolase